MDDGMDGVGGRRWRFLAGGVSRRRRHQWERRKLPGPRSGDQVRHHRGGFVSLPLNPSKAGVRIGTRSSRVRKDGRVQAPWLTVQESWQHPSTWDPTLHLEHEPPCTAGPVVPSVMTSGGDVPGVAPALSLKRSRIRAFPIAPVLQGVRIGPVSRDRPINRQDGAGTTGIFRSGLIGVRTVGSESVGGAGTGGRESATSAERPTSFSWWVRVFSPTASVPSSIGSSSATMMCAPGAGYPGDGADPWGLNCHLRGRRGWQWTGEGAAR